MKFASFDLEIATELPEDTADYVACMPLGITCAAAALTDISDVRFWRAKERLSYFSYIKLYKVIQDFILLNLKTASGIQSFS